VKLIRQREEFDCGVACLAMIAGCTYEDANAVLERDKWGTPDESLIEAARRRGVSLVRRTAPLAPLLALPTAILVIYDWSPHLVVWDRPAHRLLDPADTNARTPQEAEARWIVTGRRVIRSLELLPVEVEHG